MATEDYLKSIENYTAQPKQELAGATSELAGLQTAAGGLPAKLRQALNEKLNYNKDIINQQADTMQSYFNAGPQAREKYRDVWDPFKKAELVQQDRSMALRPYDVLQSVLDQRTGDVKDIVSEGVSGWQGLVNAATTKAQLAQSNLASALDDYKQAVSMDQWEREFNKPKGGGAPKSDFEQMIENLIMNEFNTDNNVNGYVEPPETPSKAGIKKEWPIGSGVVWTSNAQGGWD